MGWFAPLRMTATCMRLALIGSLIVLVPACGGPSKEEQAILSGGNTGGGGTKEPTPVPFKKRTKVSHISYGGGVNKVKLEMIDSDGFCIVNFPDAVIALAGDFAARPIGEGVAIGFYVERGRGVIEEAAFTDDTGVAEATFQSLCPTAADTQVPEDFTEPITLVAAVRGAEPFTDLNDNGKWDEGEPYQDLPVDAFLDGNLNGIYEPELNEYLIYDKNHNGIADGPDGVYDNDNVIAATLIILPTMAEAATATPGGPSTATPVPTSTRTATEGPSSTPTGTAIPTATRSATAFPTDTATPEATDTPPPTATATSMPTSTDTPQPTATSTPTNTDTPLPTATQTSTVTPSATPTDTAIPPTATATDTPPLPTPTNTDTPVPPTPTDTATVSPETPTETPTATATATDTASMETPTETPTATATATDTVSAETPTETPTTTPTETVTDTPTETPTGTPTGTAALLVSLAMSDVP